MEEERRDLLEEIHKMTEQYRILVGRVLELTELRADNGHTHQADWTQIEAEQSGQ